MVGIAIRKLNLEAVLLSKPKNKPVEIVIPDLEVPGIKAMDWANPIINASLIVISSIVVFLGILYVAANRTTPNTIVVIAIIELVRKKESIRSTKRKPKSRVGRDEIINWIRSLLFEGNLSLKIE